jgi:hypothetical protein
MFRFRRPEDSQVLTCSGDCRVEDVVRDVVLIGVGDDQIEGFPVQDFEGFLESRAPGSKLIGSQLVKLGYLSETDLKKLVSYIL